MLLWSILRRTTCCLFLSQTRHFTIDLDILALYRRSIFYWASVLTVRKLFLLIMPIGAQKLKQHALSIESSAHALQFRHRLNSIHQSFTVHTFKHWSA